jgi:hypothetical protein
MKLGKPVDQVPPSGSGRNDGKYAEIYRAVDNLREDQWLPVSFETIREAYNFRIAIETHRTRLMDGKQRKCVVYVRNKVTTNGTRKERASK